MSNISRIDEALRRIDGKLSRMIEEETSFGVSDVDKFRNGVFTLRTRRFGTLAEIMVQRLFGLDTSNTLKYDLKDVDNLGNPIRVEVKFSTVLSKSQSSINPDNLVSQCIEANPLNRMMALLS